MPAKKPEPYRSLWKTCAELRDDMVASQYKDCTPVEVSRTVARIIGLGGDASGQQSLYDPACGSGSLLLKVREEALGKAWLLRLYGQEMDSATLALARMNLLLHECPTAEIRRGDSLSAPLFKETDGSLKTFDFVVAHPPFSSDCAFLPHVLASLKNTGRGAVILPHGVLIHSGVEATIRRDVVRGGFIKGIIGLPPNLFPGTTLPACIIVLDREHAAARKGIFLIDASRGSLKDGNKNRLRARDVQRIADAFNRQIEIDRYSRMVPLAEIEANGFNLGIPLYIDSNDPAERWHLADYLDGIPNRDVDALDRYWQVFPGLRPTLFEPADRPGHMKLKVSAAGLKTAILEHPELDAFSRSVITIWEEWQSAHTPHLKGIAAGGSPQALIEALSEGLLQAFSKVRLVDPYELYQRLMDYWAETMGDDVCLVLQEGWKAVLDGKPNTGLIPEELLIQRCFFGEQMALHEEHRRFFAKIKELEEKHGGKEGLLARARTSEGELTRESVKARLAGISYDSRPAAVEERCVLYRYLALLDDEADARKKLKDGEKALADRAAAKYPGLTEGEIKILLVDDKWLTALAGGVRSELDRVSQAFAGRIQQLYDRQIEALAAPGVQPETSGLPQTRSTTSSRPSMVTGLAM